MRSSEHAGEWSDGEEEEAEAEAEARVAGSAAVAAHWLRHKDVAAAAAAAAAGETALQYGWQAFAAPDDGTDGFGVGDDELEEEEEQEQEQAEEEAAEEETTTQPAARSTQSTTVTSVASLQALHSSGGGQGAVPKEHGKTMAQMAALAKPKVLGATPGADQDDFIRVMEDPDLHPNVSASSR
jgi:hypothetical protein